MANDSTTVDGTPRPRRRTAPAGLTLTLLWHPDPDRIGTWTSLAASLGETIDVSRATPTFDDGFALCDARVSRSPLQLVLQTDGGARLFTGREGLRFAVHGRPGRSGDILVADDMHRGVPLRLGNGALLLVESGVRGRPAAEHHGLVGSSPALDRLRREISRSAASRSPALITSETGTGKELVARALHAASARSRGPFVAVNLSAITTGTAASQLFGHVRGAFTGAEHDSRGFFGEADGGTLLLDEVGATQLEVQALLLRALETSDVQPVGGAIRRSDARVIAATDENLQAAIADGRFRAPLYHRLARSELYIPPLRERPADIACQVVWFLRAAGAGDRLRPADIRTTPWLGPDVLEAALGHAWPGNSRELARVAERMVSQDDGDEMCRWPGPEPAPVARPAVLPEENLEQTLARHDYRLKETARALGIAPNTLRRRMRALGLPRPADLTSADIRRALAEATSAQDAARRLRVSVAGLRLRATELGIELTVA